MSCSEFYGRFVAALRVIDRRRWQRRGEKLLNLHPGDLDLVGCADLSNGFLSRIEDLVSQAMRDKAAALRAQADEIESAARKFDDQSELRRFKVRQATRRVYEDEVEDLVMQLYAWTFRHNDTQEAA